VEQRLLLEQQLQKRKQDAALAAEAAALEAAKRVKDVKEDLSVPLSEEERKARVDRQIADWRAAAGFKGTSSEIHADLRGRIIWYIDLDPTGRVILHANKRTFHGSLKGGKVTNLTGEIEVGVRDALWTEGEPLSNFNVFGGSRAETRLAWKERLEILIRGLR